MKSVMEEFASLGVDVAITELDLRIRLPADEKSLAVQAADYASVVRACRATPRCVGVTTWGITDDHSWIPAFFSGYGAALPFDEAYQPKPAVAAMIKAFDLYVISADGKMKSENTQKLVLSLAPPSPEQAAPAAAPKVLCRISKG